MTTAKNKIFIGYNMKIVILCWRRWTFRRGGEKLGFSLLGGIFPDGGMSKFLTSGKDSLPIPQYGKPCISFIQFFFLFTNLGLDEYSLMSAHE